MRGRTKRILTGVCGAAALGTAYAAVDLFVRAAVNRRPPRLLNWMSRKFGGGESSFSAARAAAAKRLAQEPMQTVEICAADGTRLVGHWQPGQNPKRVILAMHGWRSSWSKDFGLLADFLRDSECAVLYAEQRGQNQSGGDYMTFGMQERFDCQAWAAYLTAHCPHLPVYLAGISMGATTVLMAAGLALPRQVRGVIADCGFTSPQAIWNHVSRVNFHALGGIHAAASERIFQRRLRMDGREISTTDALRRCRIPVLFIHGAEDHFVPLEMTLENYRVCAAPKRLLIVPGAGHAMSYYQEEAQYQQAVRQFWEKYDPIEARAEAEIKQVTGTVAEVTSKGYVK